MRPVPIRWDCRRVRLAALLSAEIKQYSCDLALTLVALLLVAGPVSVSARRPSRSDAAAPAPGPRRLRAIGVWFSYPSRWSFGVGTYLFAVRRSAAMAPGPGLVLMGLVWALSFAACYVVSHGILTQGAFIWDWWDFAFLPLPPRSRADLTRDFWRWSTSQQPGRVLTAIGRAPSAFLALGLFLLGGVVARIEVAGGLYLLLAPILFALVASARTSSLFTAGS